MGLSVGLYIRSWQIFGVLKRIFPIKVFTIPSHVYICGDSLLEKHEATLKTNKKVSSTCLQHLLRRWLIPVGVTNPLSSNKAFLVASVCFPWMTPYPWVRTLVIHMGECRG